jgi:hypothetical protein
MNLLSPTTSSICEALKIIVPITTLVPFLGFHIFDLVFCPHSLPKKTAMNIFQESLRYTIFINAMIVSMVLALGTADYLGACAGEYSKQSGSSLSLVNSVLVWIAAGFALRLSRSPILRSRSHRTFAPSFYHYLGFLFALTFSGYCGEGATSCIAFIAAFLVTLVVSHCLTVFPNGSRAD